ncbi:MAG: efflux RND transporter periplasmic adaptor subunit [Alphaproteobacteria bacterium]|nr:MAG: efflux RND transporter periplasmic adaptor subunit [Alphaproteobacteria bacterium]
MRFLSLFNTALVAVALYLLVMERDTLRAFAAGDALERPAAQATAPAEAAAEAGLGATAREIDEIPVKVVAIHSQAREIPDGVVLRGRTEADRRVDVRSETSGRVVSEPQAKGSPVKAGDVLCRIDEGTRPARVAEARARLAQAEDELEAAEKLASGGFASERRLINARAQLESARAALAAAEDELARTVIRAPFDGVLDTDTAELGSLLQPGALCARVVDLDPILLVGWATEMDVGRIRVGAPAGGRLLDGRELHGKVTHVGVSADPATRTYRVEIAVPNPDGAIRDGATVEIFIALAGTRAHEVPASALTLDGQGRLGLRLIEDGRARFHPVEVLRDAPNGVWVSGLPETADIIVVGQEFVTDGRRVEPSWRSAAESDR